MKRKSPRTYQNSLALTWKAGLKIVPSQAKRPKTSLRKSSIKKHEIAQNCPFFAPTSPPLSPDGDRIPSC